MDKKLFRRAAAVLCVFLLAVGLAGCSGHGSTKTYILPDVYVDGEDLVKRNKDTDSCEDIYLNDDGSLTLVLTEAQRKRWSDHKEIEAQLSLMSKLSGITIRFSDAYTKMEVSAPRDVARAAAPMAYSFAWVAELCQILNGAETWSLQVTISESESGTVLQEAILPEDQLDWSFLEDSPAE